jgi:hypothetical protein
MAAAAPKASLIGQKQSGVMRMKLPRNITVLRNSVPLLNKELK